MIHKEDLLAIGSEKLRRFATYASIGVASTLILAKIAAWLLTDSVTMLSSLLDSTIDLMASLVTAYGVANALRPPDHNHRFGHGKAEPLAALTQAAFIVGSSVLLAYEALQRLYAPQSIQHENVAYWVMGLAIVLTILLLQIQRFVTRHTGSMAIHADSMHYAGDLASNLAVIVAFVLYQTTGITWIDPVFGLCIAAYLIRSAKGIAMHALNALMDQEISTEDKERIKTIILAQPKVQGIHDMRTRSDSDRIFIEAHVEMDGSLPLREAHDVAERIICAVEKEFPNADILVHQDPAGLMEDRLDNRIERQEAATAHTHAHAHHGHRH